MQLYHQLSAFTSVPIRPAIATITLTATLFSPPFSSPAQALLPTLQWKQQLGTSLLDESYDVATDSNSNVYISGSVCKLGGTAKPVGGNRQNRDLGQTVYLRDKLPRLHLTSLNVSGSCDAGVAKFSSNGTLLWKKQLASLGNDRSTSVTVDRTGNVYISGDTTGALAGTYQGSNDSWVAKYNSTGKAEWRKQLGTTEDDRSQSVTVDSTGNVYISGYTTGALAGTSKGGYDAWVAKYNNSGILQWKQQLGTAGDDRSFGVAADSTGNVYISGYTTGPLAGTSKGGFSDAWMAKYASSGKLQWKKQLGTSSYDTSSGIAIDRADNIYISGYTEGALAGTYQGGGDAWAAKYDSSGKLQWKKQLGCSSYDTSLGVTTDSNGNVYITGYTEGALAGTYQGGGDAWAAKYDSNGSLQWKQQLGTSTFDISFGVAVDSTGSVYISGDTYGSLAGTYQGGGGDAWDAKYSQ
jgi:hypothetical protein